MMKTFILGIIIVGSLSSFSFAAPNSQSISNIETQDSLLNLLYSSETKELLLKELCTHIGNIQVKAPVPIVNLLGDNPSICDNKEYILSSRICSLASTALFGMLREKFPNIDFYTVRTKDMWLNFYHVFIVVDNYYPDGDDLIIDPSYTQFLIDKNNIDTIINDLHPIFAGRYSELEQLHNIYGRNNPEYYLNTGFWF